MHFLISLLTPTGAASVARTTPQGALCAARSLAQDGDVVITTPAGNILDPGEFAMVWGLT
jgi:hypothetical protein